MTLLDAAHHAEVVEEDVKGGRGFYRPRGWGILGLGPVGTGVLVVGVLICAICIAIPGGTWVMLATVVLLGGFLLWAAVPDRHGWTGMMRHLVKRGYRKSRRAGSTVYTPGGLTDMGSHRLPGAMASSHLSNWKSAAGEEFAILTYPKSSFYVVTASASPDGASLLDEVDMITQVQRFDDWISDLAQQPDFVEAIVTIETAPHSGPLMRKAAKAGESDRATPLSRKVVGELIEQFPQGTHGVSVTATATFRAPRPEIGMDGKPIPRSEREPQDELVGRLLADRVPHLFDALPECGAGSIRLMGTDELIERVRVAYNPGDRKAYEDARAKGMDRPVTLWAAAGPHAANEHWNYYEIGGGAAITWEFTGFTTQLVRPDGLLPLFESDPGSSTRVSIIYQPLAPELASRTVERNFNSALSRFRDARKPTARQMLAVRRANQARTSEASGRALVDFTVLVTRTVTDVKQLPRTRASIGRLGPNARLNLRPCDGQQAVAFAQGIGPLGLVANHHLRMPQGLMSGI